MDPQALEAALQVAGRHGLTNPQVTVLHDHCNLVLTWLEIRALIGAKPVMTACYKKR